MKMFDGLSHQERVRNVHGLIWNDDKRVRIGIVVEQRTCTRLNFQWDTFDGPMIICGPCSHQVKKGLVNRHHGHHGEVHDVSTGVQMLDFRRNRTNGKIVKHPKDGQTKRRKRNEADGGLDCPKRLAPH